MWLATHELGRPGGEYILAPSKSICNIHIVTRTGDVHNQATRATVCVLRKHKLQKNTLASAAISNLQPQALNPPKPQTSRTNTARAVKGITEDPGISLYMSYPGADRNGQKIGMRFDPNRIFQGQNVTNVRYFMRTDHLSRHQC